MNNFKPPISVANPANQPRLDYIQDVASQPDFEYSTVRLLIHSFIRSGYFYSASLSPLLLLRGAPDTARMLCSEFHAEANTQATAGEGLA